VLHPRVGGNDEESGQPGTDADQKSGDPVAFWPEPLLAENQQPEEARFEKEREYTLHGQGLPDDTPSGFGETRPIGAELEFHRDAGYHSEGEVDGEDPDPKASRVVVVLASRAERDRFQNQDQQRQAHGQLGEQVMKSNREGEVQAVNG